MTKNINTANILYTLDIFSLLLYLPYIFPIVFLNTKKHIPHQDIQNRLFESYI